MNAAMVIVGVMFLLLIESVNDKDDEINAYKVRVNHLEKMEKMAATCRPTKESEIAILAIQNGEIQCAISRRSGYGLRQIVRTSY